MIDPIHFVTNLYSWMIGLFPGEFQSDFGEELQYVFRSTANEAVHTGGVLALTRVCLHELHDLPGNIVHEHLANLRKADKRNRTPGLKSPSRFASRGALGFGIGFGLLIVFRWLFDPHNDLIFINFGMSLMRETVLFGLLAAFGWAMISSSTLSPMINKRLVIASLLFGATGGLLATSFIVFSHQFFSVQLKAIQSLGILVQFVGALIYGGFIGAIFGSLNGHRKRFFHMVLSGAICFGASFLISEGAFHLFYLLPIPWSWTMKYWAIPLTIGATIDGLIGGALLGWIVEREKPTWPTRLVARKPAGNSRPILGDIKIYAATE